MAAVYDRDDISMEAGACSGLGGGVMDGRAFKQIKSITLGKS